MLSFPALVTMVTQYGYQMVSEVQKEPQPVKDASITSIVVSHAVEVK